MKATVLVVDDAPENLQVLAELVEREGHQVQTAGDGAAALASIATAPPDIILSDVVMPNIDGFELCRRVKENPATRLLPVVLVTGMCEREARIDGINAGADEFLTKPFDAQELHARIRALLRMKRFTDELDSAESMILRLAVVAEARAGYDRGHCERMAAYAAAFGVHLELSTGEIAALHRGGYLHDIGKIAIPDAVLAKPGRLSAAEFEALKRHTTVGDALCADLRSLTAVRPIVRHHHERFDGGGYPDGLCGGEIPLLAQIMGLVDLYEALTTDRPYRPASTEAAACAELEREAMQGWRRPDLVDAFLTFCRSGRLRRASRRAA
jgi:putative two-component system response regulator